jgi:hypothetical protein
MWAKLSRWRLLRRVDTGRPASGVSSRRAVRVAPGRAEVAHRDDAVAEMFPEAQRRIS